MTHVSEVAPDFYRISIYVPDYNLQFNHFLVNDDEPLLFHTGLRRMFPEVRDGVARIVDPVKIRWISFSHLEPDECGSLNQWLAAAPTAQAVTGLVGGMMMDDYADRTARVLAPDQTLTTGKYRFRYYPTPQLPHGWDAGVLFEEQSRTLLCSDLFFHNGDVPAITESDIVGPAKESLRVIQQGPLADIIPYTQNTGRILDSLAELKPITLATMHGSSFTGDCAEALRDLNTAMREVLVEPEFKYAIAG
jgi:flavorubredoxin